MSIPSVFGLKGMAVAAAIGLAAGAYAGYRVTDAFGEARALRIERDTLNATIAARDETIARNARLTTGVNDIAISVSRAITQLKEAVGDEASIRSDPGSDYTDDEFGRLLDRIARAAQPGTGLPAAARP